MFRHQLEHIIRASASIADGNELIIIGSQSILGSIPDAPAELRVSNEADVYPRNHPDRADLVEGSIGENSVFHETFGYFAQAVSERKAILPAGWKGRLHPVHNENTGGATGWCLDPHDLFVAKLVAGREKDLDYISAAARHGLLELALLLERLASTTLPDETRQLAEHRARRLAGTGQ